MPAQTLTRRGQEWVPVHGGGRPFMVGRDGLVAGVDKPTAQTTGVHDGVELTPVYPPAGQYVIALSPGTYENQMFWGQVRPQQSSNANEYVFRNCWFAGADFNWSNYDTNLTGLVFCGPSSSNLQSHLVFVDCTFNPKVWFDGHPLRPAGWTPSAEAPARQAQTAGVHGGNFELRRCEIVNAQDGVNYVGTNVSSCLVELSWIHGNYFRNDWYGPSDGRCHSDAFQFNVGSNVTLRGNILGGHRDMTGYRTWPGGYNSGDDAWNAAIMLKQERSNTTVDKIENVLIEKNWIYGGTAGINFPYNPSHPNTFSTTIIRDNRFGARGSGWRASANGPGTYETGQQDGWYIIRSTSLAASITGNIIEGTGSAVPIQNG